MYDTQISRRKLLAASGLGSLALASGGFGNSLGADASVLQTSTEISPHRKEIPFSEADDDKTIQQNLFAEELSHTHLIADNTNGKRTKRCISACLWIWDGDECMPYRAIRIAPRLLPGEFCEVIVDEVSVCQVRFYWGCFFPRTRVCKAAKGEHIWLAELSWDKHNHAHLHCSTAPI